jgi:hypothetical protein
MDKTATTNDVGLFTIYNVPALNGAGNEITNANPRYPVTIDMSAVNAAIVAANTANKTTKALYPSMAFDDVDVLYSSLGETAGATTSTNHDTPVNGFVANITPFVGKLDANVKIQVVNTGLAVQSGATVYLYYNNAGTAIQSGTGTGTNGGSTAAYDGGAPGMLISTKTTDATGYVTFTNIEAKRQYVVKAVMGATQGWWVGIAGINQAVPASGGPIALTSPSDNLTDIYGLNQAGSVSASPELTIGAYYSAPIVVRSVDGISPFVLAVSPANLSDFAIPTATATLTTVDTVFTFSEPLASNAYANALTRETSVNGGLYADVAVNYLGPKAGNIPHTLAWNTERTTLTVSIPIASMTAASRYTVSILNACNKGTAAGLIDANRNWFLAPFTNTAVNFTTAGGFNVAAPVIVRDATSPYTVNWTPVTNAFGYRVYAEAVAGTGFFPVKLRTAAAFTTLADVFNNVNAANAVITTPTTFSLTLLDGTAAPAATSRCVIGQKADLSFYNVTADGFAGGKAYNVFVVALSSNGSESAPSNIVAVSETKPAAPGTPVRRGTTAASEYLIDWTAVAGATQYTIWVQTLQNGAALAGYVPIAANSIDPTYNLAGVIATGTMGQPGYIPANLPFAGTGVAVNGYPLGAKLSYNVAVSTTSPTNTLTSDLSSSVLIEDKRGVALAGRAAGPVAVWTAANNGQMNIGAATVAPPVALAPVPNAAQAANGSYFGASAKTSLAFTQAVTIQASEQLSYSSAIDATKYTIAQLTATAFGTGKPALAGAGSYQAADAAVTAIADIIPTITGIAYTRALPIGGGNVGPGFITFTLNYAGTGTVAAPGTIAGWYGAAGSLVLQSTPVDLNANALPLFDNGTGNVGGVIMN